MGVLAGGGSVAVGAGDRWIFLKLFLVLLIQPAEAERFSVSFMLNFNLWSAFKAT